jgi:Flp pilus assembly protein CpaB
MDETCKGEKEMSEMIILTSLVLIIGLLGFIAVMIWGIGDKLAEKDK